MILLSLLNPGLWYIAAYIYAAWEAVNYFRPSRGEGILLEREGGVWVVILSIMLVLNIVRALLHSQGGELSLGERLFGAAFALVVLVGIFLTIRSTTPWVVWLNRGLLVVAGIETLLTTTVISGSWAGEAYIN